MKQYTIDFPNGNKAIVIQTREGVAPEFIGKTLKIPTQWPVLVLSGGAGGMTDEHIRKLNPLFTAVGNTLVREQVLVIDGGTKSGVMALMGEALGSAGRTAPYIGVLPAYAEVQPGELAAENLLEPHHSHFILIENDKWGSESKTMCDLATYFSTDASSLVLLVNGGEISLKDIELNVMEGREIVVLAGSGRLADEIANAVRYPAHKKRDRIETLVKKAKITLFDVTEPSEDLIKYLKTKLKVGSSK